MNMIISRDGAEMESVERVIARACAVAEDDGSAIEAAVRDAAHIRLDAARAERLYTRVLEELRGLHRVGVDSVKAEAVRERIRREVRALVAEVDRPAATDTTEEGSGVALVARNGFRPRDVFPVPTFNGTVVPMVEGYVDVTTLDPWAENHRVVLFVDEFEEKNGRKPTADELLEILTGDITLGSEKNRDPFDLRPLAESIARKGVERPPILTFNGVPCDGNRRIASARMIVNGRNGKKWTDEQKERARWVRVWRAPPSVTKDQLDAIVVALNFEDDHKKPWPEYVKARMVIDEFRHWKDSEGRLPGRARVKEIKEAVAKKFAIGSDEVTRYYGMVQWADDFIDYHAQAGKPRGAVQHRTDTIFQWFYELGAGRTGEKVVERFDAEPELRAMVYDMMYDDTIESGAQVRALWTVANHPDGYKQLVNAHQLREKEGKEAKELIRDAVIDARARVRARKAIGLDQYLRGLTDRLGETPPSAWKDFPTEFLVEIRASLARAVGALDGELSARGHQPVAGTP